MIEVMSSLLNVLSKDFVIEGIKNFVAIKKKFESKRINFKSPLEKKRFKIISKIQQLNYEIILNITKSDQFTKAQTVLFEQLLNTYKAATEEQLNNISLIIDQVSGILANYAKMKRKIKIAQIIAIFFSLMILAGIIVLIFLSNDNQISVNSIIPILELPLPIVVWSIIGSIASILYRFNISMSKEIQNPLRWIITRPLIGIIFGSISYYIFKVGLISIGAESTIESIGASEITWLIAFLASFSDKFSDSLLKSLVGKFKDTNEELMLDTEDESIISSPIKSSIKSAFEWSQRLTSSLFDRKQSKPADTTEKREKKSTNRKYKTKAKVKNLNSK